jgi:hypothetical protein
MPSAGARSNRCQVEPHRACARLRPCGPDEDDVRLLGLTAMAVTWPFRNRALIDRAGPDWRHTVPFRLIRRPFFVSSVCPGDCFSLGVGSLITGSMGGLTNERAVDTTVRGLARISGVGGTPPRSSSLDLEVLLGIIILNSGRCLRDRRNRAGDPAGQSLPSGLCFGRSWSGSLCACFGSLGSCLECFCLPFLPPY